MEFQVMPDPADVVLAGSGTPVLTFEHSHARGPGWVLHCPDATAGVESYYLGGDLEDVDSAEEAAEAKLTALADDSDTY